MSDRANQEQHERAAALRRRAAKADGAADERQPHPLITLGGQVGNAQVARLFAQRQGEEEEELMARHDLTQRQGEEEEELQAKPEVGLEGGPLSAGLTERINASRGGGAPLDGGTLERMEGAFDAGFADVRLHTDAESDALNRSISAKAFTTGSDIYFRRDTSPGDQGLLAHELSHVVQQREMTGGGGGLTVGPADDAHERAADATATAVTSGATLRMKDEG